VSGVKEKQGFPFGQLVFERAVGVDECELRLRVCLGWGRLTFFGSLEI
jgi:hypothetical protein